MKQIILIITIITAPLVFSQTWQNFGSAPFSAGNVSGTVIALNDADIPYVAYNDVTQSNKATVMKYNGSAWVLVGTAGFSSQTASGLSMAVLGSNSPYVAYSDPSISNKLAVKMFDGVNWVNVGNPAISSSDIYSPCIKINDLGEIFVAYRDVFTGSNATVIKWNGASWTTLGSAGFSGELSQYISLDFNSSNQPVVAYATGTGGANCWQFDGSNWNQIGTTVTSSGFLKTDLTMVNDTPYIVFVDGANSNQARVITYNGSAWVNVGTGASSGEIDYPSITSSASGDLFICYRDTDQGGSTTVMKYNGLTWDIVGGTAGFSGFTPFTGRKTIAATSAGDLFVSLESGGAKVMSYACIVNVPDANFKAYLLGNTSINTNADTEISCAEATAYTSQIWLQNLGITDLTGIEAFVNITSLNCNTNSITSIDLSQNTQLAVLVTAGNPLASLDVSNLSMLYNLNASYNDLTALDLSNNPNLGLLACSDNALTSLDLTQNLQLTELDIASNMIAGLDLSLNSALIKLYASTNDLSQLNIANGNNTNVTAFYTDQNPNLTCVEVDDDAYSTANWLNIDVQTSFSLNCCTINNSSTVSGVTITSTQSGASYQWINCATMSTIAGATSQSFTATIDGTYACIVDDGNCIDTTACQSIVGVGIDEYDQMTMVFPNPFDNQIEVISNHQIQEVIILDMQGKELVKSIQTKIDLSELAPGAYILSIQTEDRRIEKRLIKK